MKLVIYSMLFAGFLLPSVASMAATTSEQLEKQLDTCRQQYKRLVNTTNEELKILKKQAPVNLPEIYKQKQNEIKNKAAVCKKIKQEAEDAKKREDEEARKFAEITSPIVNAPAGQKIGPKFRCLQLGQNWSEFKTCTQSIGYSPEIKFTNNGYVFRTSNEVVTAVIDQNHHVIALEISGDGFWGTKSFDEDFLNAFMEHYGIDRLTPEIEQDQLKARLYTHFLGDAALGHLTFYKGEIEGGSVRIYSGLHRILIMKTRPVSSYTF